LAASEAPPEKGGGGFPATKDKRKRGEKRRDFLGTDRETVEGRGIRRGLVQYSYNCKTR
jgi:hypothetical protein